MEVMEFKIVIKTFCVDELFNVIYIENSDFCPSAKSQCWSFILDFVDLFKY